MTVAARTRSSSLPTSDGYPAATGAASPAFPVSSGVVPRSFGSLEEERASLPAAWQQAMAEAVAWLNGEGADESPVQRPATQTFPLSR